MTPLFHSSGNAKIGKEERHRYFGDLIFGNNFRKLKLKLSAAEGIYAAADPLPIVSFPAAVPMESFQLKMGFSFQFLRANYIRSSLLNIRAHSFYSLVSSGFIRKVSVQLVPKYFSHIFQY